jgi:hypothetical protein
MKIPTAIAPGVPNAPLQTVCEIAAERNKLDLVTKGVLAPATKLLLHDEIDIRSQASLLLYTLTNSFDVRQAIRKEKLPTLANTVTLLNPEQGPVCNENASGICANMSAEFSSRVELSKTGGMAGRHLHFATTIRFNFLFATCYAKFVFRRSRTVGSTRGSSKRRWWCPCAIVATSATSDRARREPVNCAHDPLRHGRPFDETDWAAVATPAPQYRPHRPHRRHSPLFV